MPAAIYTRVITADQIPELQLREIQDYAERQGCPVVDLCQDVANGAAENRGKNTHPFGW